MVTAATPGCISAPHSCRSVGKWTSQGIFIDLSFYTPGYERDKRLPTSSFHYRMLGLIGGGMFLDAFEIYLQGAVLAALLG